MNYSIKCLVCKCKKWFNWGKSCRQCLKDNDVCSAGDYEVKLGDQVLGTSKYVILNKKGNYAEAREDLNG